MPTAQLTAHVDRAGTWAAIAIGAALPVSVALDNVLLALVLAAWILSGSWREKIAFLGSNTVLLAALVLFAWLALATAWSVGPPRDTAGYLVKYIDLLLAAPLAWQLRAPDRRRAALYAFAGSAMTVLAASYLIGSGLLPASKLLLGTPDNPVVFKHYLTHGLLMAFACFLLAELALQVRRPRWRALLAVSALLAAVNVLFMVSGRTGYVVLAVLALYFGWRVIGWRGLAAAAALVLALGATLLAIPGTFQDRWQTAVRELESWHGNAPADSSAALRLEYYRNTLAIVHEHPLIGVGTGGFPTAYRNAVADTGAVATRNPHNEFLHIAAQAGIPGLALLLAMFVMQWRRAPRLPTPLEQHAARGLVLVMVAGSLFNSMLLDHTEGLLFAWMTAVLFAGLPRQER